MKSVVEHSAPALGQSADQLATRSNGVIRSARKTTDDALDSLEERLTDLHQAAPAALGRAAAQVEGLARRGVQRARDATSQAQDKLAYASDRTVSYIRDEPVKSVLIAAATGVGIAYLVSCLTASGRRTR